MILKKLEEKPIIFFFIILIFHYWSLMRFPPAHEDEAWVTSRAWSFLQTGLVFGTLDQGVYDRFEGYWTFFPRFFPLIQALGLNLYGSLSLLPVRIISLVFGMILLIAVYLISKALGNNRLAILSVIIVSLSATFIYSAHLARPDIIAAAAGYLAIALLLRDKFTRWWIGLISGLLIGIAFEIHPHIAIFALTIFLLYFYKNGISALKNWNFWGYISGLIIGGIIYLSMHVLPYPHSFLKFNELVFLQTHTPPILSGNLATIGSSLGNTAVLLGLIYLFSTPLILISGYFLAIRGTPNQKTILFLALVIVISSGLLIGNRFIYYQILITPIIDVVLATLILRVINILNSKEKHTRIIAYIPLGIIIGMLIVNVFRIRDNYQDADLNVAKRIDEEIDSSDDIMGSQIYWFGLAEHGYYSWEQIIYYQRLEPGSTIREAFSGLKPNIFIVDDHLRVFLSNFEGGSTFYHQLKLSKSELFQFLDDQAILLTEFDGGVYGQIQVYKINWKSD